MTGIRIGSLVVVVGFMVGCGAAPGDDAPAEASSGEDAGTDTTVSPDGGDATTDAGDSGSMIASSGSATAIAMVTPIATPCQP